MRSLAFNGARHYHLDLRAAMKDMIFDGIARAKGSILLKMAAAAATPPMVTLRKRADLSQTTWAHHVSRGTLVPAGTIPVSDISTRDRPSCPPARCQEPQRTHGPPLPRQRAR